MAAARQCDCCGDFYKAYNTKENRFKINGFIPLNIDNSGQYWSHKQVDLCPKCIKPVLDIMDKVKENIGGK